MSKFFFYWLPRILAILLILFISVFALDVLEEHASPAQIATDLFMHLIPSLVLLIVLIAAWRWEWIGALVFAGAGAFYLYSVWIKHSIAPQQTFEQHVGISLLIAGPALLVAFLFLVGWFSRHKLRGA
ncbi:MAG: hypothetical protein KGJ78_02475 [Alphaproteobacteria bacterium]|nr:hypothetical protein [Alphaproteobacteria bacterium]